MRAARRTLLVASLVAGPIVLLAGCASSSDPQTEMIRKNPTPELDTLYQTPDDVQNVLAIMENENRRMRNQDLGRVFYTDRPSRLTREPVPW